MTAVDVAFLQRFLSHLCPFLRSIRIVAILSVFAVTACSKPSPQAIKKTVTAGYIEPLVTEVPQQLSFSATTAARQTVDVVARTRGFIEKVVFTDGQMVKQNDLLYRLEAVVNQAELERATGRRDEAVAEVAESRIEFTRYQRLVDLGSTSEDTLDQARQNYQSALGSLDQANANLRRIRQDLTYTEVRASFAGKMGRTLYYPGQLVGELNSTAATVLTTIAQLDSMYVYFNVPSKYLQTLMAARHKNPVMPLVFETQGEHPIRFSGQLDFIDRGVNPTTGTIEMRGLISNSSLLLYPGQVGKLTLQFGVQERQLMVPSESILLDGLGSFVWLINKDNRIIRHSVKRHEVFSPWTRVSGLQQRDRVLASRLGTVRAGQKVKPHKVKPNLPMIDILQQAISHRPYSVDLDRGDN
ncbi:Efflux pump periplasmic linker BepF [BD1-7 clade bacterium]|uniref:Efflux pump periplasmic linker BepF n=1 Tax=BD1-7 clade bacterium TaxID=2029982 RepID=A0A5S9P5J3_9GAMM|nr:Efflux pump periplasmic linker BepF [BD1-7 clade bacterium]CAA0098457.1 Efflux pump periplasmic linker BepF [BD1-7 clade bacterium]